MKPIIILSKPQLSKNIGSVARALANLSFDELRLVNPRDGWPNKEAMSTSTGAENLIRIKSFDSLYSACEDINLLISTSVRKRDLNIRELNIEEAINKSIVMYKNNKKTGFLFGCESSGLSNDEIVMSDYIFSIPTNSEFSSLNLSHAVFLVCWEFYKMVFVKKIKSKTNYDNSYEIATYKEKDFFFNKLNFMLNETNFFHSEYMSNSIMKNIKSIFNRSSLTSSEVKTLNGIIKSLYNYNKQA